MSTERRVLIYGVLIKHVYPQAAEIPIVIVLPRD